MSAPRSKLSWLIRATQLPAQPDPAEADAAWYGLEARRRDRLRGRARARRWAVGLSFAAATAAVAVGLGRRAPETALDVGRAFESSGDQVSLALPDGVHVDLGPHSRVSVDRLTGDEARVGLGLGTARFDVEPRHGRRFVVGVDGFEVRVIGTRFTVTRVQPGAAGAAAARIEVAVERGVVEVWNPRDDKEPRRLHAGERFSAPLPPAPPTETTLPPPPIEPRAPEAPGAAAVSPSRSPAPAADPAQPAGPSADPAPGGATSVGTARLARGEGARVLLERAQDRWRAGRMAAAAALYEEVLAHHPGDPRAALAALELGRIQMDHLGDPAGAVASLERAIRLAPRAPFHEDALARLAQANARLGRMGACARARDDYFARYAGGIHASIVSQACQRRR